MGRGIWRISGGTDTGRCHWRHTVWVVVPPVPVGNAMGTISVVICSEVTSETRAIVVMPVVVSVLPAVVVPFKIFVVTECMVVVSMSAFVRAGIVVTRTVLLVLVALVLAGERAVSILVVPMVVLVLLIGKEWLE